MSVEPLKTAAQCDKHGKRTYACVNCGESVTRNACETWHQDQCDDCITQWAYETNEKRMIDAREPSAQVEAARFVLAWKKIIEVEKP